MHNSKKKYRNYERGDTILEFAAALPLFLILMGGIGIFAWVFWAQAAADIAAARALQEASLNRGGDRTSPASGAAFFQSSMEFLTGGETSAAVGGPVLSTSESGHLLRFDVTGQARLAFGTLDSLFKFGGGGAGRTWRFWPGPPDPWE